MNSENSFHKARCAMAATLIESWFKRAQERPEDGSADALTAATMGQELLAIIDEEQKWSAELHRCNTGLGANLVALKTAASALQRCADSLASCIAEFCDTGVEETCACRACGEHMQSLETAAERVRVLIETMNEGAV